MKKIISLLILAILCVSVETGFAQVRQNFQNSDAYVDVVVDSATLHALSHDFSVDRVRRNDDGTFNTRIWLSYLDYDNFLSREIPYTIVEPTRATVTMATNYAEMVNGWNRYPTYNTYLAMMDTFQTRYPNLCKIDTLLASTEGGHKILCAHISNNLNDNMGKPSVFYTSTMHGDEVMGYYFMLRLIDMLLSNYGTDTRLTNMVNNFDIWICPLHNPDGTYYGSNNQINNTSTYSRRGNYRNLDLNRNFPQPNQSIGSSTYYEQNHLMEVWAMMQFLGAHNFTLAANFHGGAEVFNYPWDAWVTSEHAHADDAWWQYVGRKFADTCQHYNSNYFTEENNGITEGGDWYVVDGSMQDYHNWFLGTRHVTIEVGEKVLSTSLLPTYWNYVYHSLLNFIEEADNGIHGIVTDSVSGAPLQAMVYVENHDADHSYVETNMPYGDYHRPIKAGTYSVTYSADGYFPKTITVNVADGAKLIRNVQLVSTDTTSCRKPKNVTVNYIGGNSAEVSWYSMAQSNNIMLNNTLITDVTSPYTLTDLAFSTQYDVQVQANCGDNGLSEWSESVSFTTPVACPAPTNLSCPAVTATTATLNWTENGEATDWVLQYGTNSNFTSGTYSQVEVNGNATEILTGLSAETDYYARVKADCGDVFGQSDWSATCTFKPTSIQMVEIGSGTATNSNLPLNSRRTYSLSEQIYTTAELGEAGNIVSVGFYKNSTTTCNRNLDIYLVSTDKSSFSGNSDWITVTNADKVFTGTVNFANNDWTTITLTTPFAYDGTHNVAVIVDDNTGSSGYYSIPFLTYTGSPNQSIYYNNSSTNPDPTGSPSSVNGTQASSKNQIRVTFDRPDPVVCLAPTALAASGIRGQNATLSWTENGSATSWVLQYGADGSFAEGTYTEVNVSGTPVADLTDLTAETQYYARVKTVCDVDDESDWSGICAFFATNYVVVGSGTGTNNSLPTNNAYKYSLTQQIYTVEELGEAGIVTSVEFYKNNTTQCNRKLDIYMVSTDKSGFTGSQDWIPVTAADKVFSGTVNFSHNEWTTIALNKPFAYDGEQNVAIIVDDNTGSYKKNTSFYAFPASSQALRVYSDGTNYNVSSPSNYSGTVESTKNQIRLFVVNSVPCPEPTDITVSEISHQGALLSWNGDAESWTVSYRPTSASQPTEVITTDASYTLSGLEAETEYTVNVAAVCGEETVWGEGISFTTLSAPCPAISLDAETGIWETDFEEVSIASDGRPVPSCWTLPEVYETSIATKNKPQLYNGFATSGSYSLKMRDLCVYAMPEYDMSGTPIQNLEMTFNLRQANRNYRLEVGVMTDANDPGTFVPVQLINNATTDIEEVTVSFANYETPADADRLYIAFRNKGSSSSWTYSYNYIDDIVLKARSGCGITTLPYRESFESCVSAEDGRLVPSCWTLPEEYESSIATKNKPQQYAGFATDGNYSLKMRDLCVYAMPSYAVPGTPIQDVTMTFSLRQANRNYRLEVGVMTDANDPSTFELVQLINNASTDIETVEVSFAGYVAPADAEQLFIAFHNVGSTSAWTYSYNYIDSIVIAAGGNKIAETPSGEMSGGEAMEADRYLENIKVYPNPTTGNLRIDAVDVQRVEVFNQMGQLVGVYGSEPTINLGHLAQGIYMVHITVPQGTTVRKVVKR